MKWFVKARAGRPVRRPERFRPRFEALEDRLTPSGLTGLEGSGHPVAVAPQAVSPDALIILPSPQATQVSGKYVTGAAGNATAEGVAVGSDGSQYVTGLLNDPAVSPDQVGYVIKYGPTGSVAYAVSFAVFTDPGSTAEGTGIAVDGSGNAYVSGRAFHSTDGSNNGFALKLNAAGNGSVYFYYLQGATAASPVSANGVAIDTAGDATYALQYSPSATEQDMGAIRIGPTGTVTYYYYYPFTGTTGGSANAAAMSGSGANSYLAGSITLTGSTPNAALVKLSATGTVVWATYFSSTTVDAFNAIAINAAGNSFAAGTTDNGGPTQTGVAAEVSADGQTVVWSAALTGSSAANGIALTAAGDVVVTGADSGGQAFISKLSGATGNVTDYRVFGGTGGSDVGQAVAVRPSDGHVFVVGTTNSSDFPVTDGSTLNGTTDGFLTEWTL